MCCIFQRSDEAGELDPELPTDPVLLQVCAIEKLCIVLPRCWYGLQLACVLRMQDIIRRQQAVIEELETGMHVLVLHVVVASVFNFTC